MLFDFHCFLLVFNYLLGFYFSSIDLFYIYKTKNICCYRDKGIKKFLSFTFLNFLYLILELYINYLNYLYIIIQESKNDDNYKDNIKICVDNNEFSKINIPP